MLGTRERRGSTFWSETRATVDADDRDLDDDLAPDPRRRRTQRIVAGIILLGLAVPMLGGILDLVGTTGGGGEMIDEGSGFRLPDIPVLDRILPEPSDAAGALAMFTGERMARIHRDEGFAFVAGDVPSTDPNEISVHALERSWGAGALASDGSCHLILMQIAADGQVTVSRDRLVGGSPCTGRLATPQRMPEGSAW